MRLVDLVHFNDQRKVSSSLRVDDDPPRLNGQGYVQRGAFYVTLKNGESEVTMKLTDQEAADLSLRLRAGHEQHVLQELQLQYDAASKRQATPQ